MKNNFHPGDPVLIINGRDAQHLVHVGKGTIVLSPFIQGFCPATRDIAEGYIVDFASVHVTSFGACTDLLYRHKDLMPINPINDDPIEVTNHEQEPAQAHEGNTEISRHL